MSFTRPTTCAILRFPIRWEEQFFLVTRPSHLRRDFAWR